MTREEIITIINLEQALYNRAQRMNLTFGSKSTFILDMDNAIDSFNLDLQRLLEADDFNFAHDIIGIQTNINRGTKKFENFFVPRFARN